MTTKLKIDLSQGVLEVEGTESFVREIYKDFRTQYNSGEQAASKAKTSKRSTSRRKKTTTTASASSRSKAKAEPEPTPAEEPPAEARPKSPAPSYTYLAELDLDPGADQPSLVEFMDTKFPITNEERNLVFLYYLQYMTGQEAISLDHLYTCYRRVNIRAPQNLEHSLQMTADHDWISTANGGSLTVTETGKKYVEEHLPTGRKS